MKLKAYNQEEIKLCYALCFSNTIALLKSHYTFAEKKKKTQTDLLLLFKKGERERESQTRLWEFERLPNTTIPMG